MLSSSMNYLYRAAKARREIRKGKDSLATVVEQLKISRCKGMLRCLSEVVFLVDNNRCPILAIVHSDSLAVWKSNHTYPVSIHSLTATCTCLLLSLLPVPCVCVCQQTRSRRRRGSFCRAACRPCGRPPSPPRDSCPSTSSDTSRRRRKRTTGWRYRPCYRLRLRPSLLLPLLQLLL